MAYACHVILANTKAWVDKKELGAMVGRSGKPLEAALKSLAAAGLAELSPGRARSPVAGRYVVPPVVSPATSGIYARLQAHRDEWARSCGKVDFARYLMVRSSKGKFAAYLPHLTDVIGMSALYGDIGEVDDPALYLVEGRVTRLFNT